MWAFVLPLCHLNGPIHQTQSGLWYPYQSSRENIIFTVVYEVEITVVIIIWKISMCPMLLHVLLKDVQIVLFQKPTALILNSSEKLPREKTMPSKYTIPKWPIIPATYAYFELTLKSKNNKTKVDWYCVCIWFNKVENWNGSSQGKIQRDYHVICKSLVYVGNLASIEFWSTCGIVKLENHVHSSFYFILDFWQKCTSLSFDSKTIKHSFSTDK